MEPHLPVSNFDIGLDAAGRQHTISRELPVWTLCFPRGHLQGGKGCHMEDSIVAGGRDVPQNYGPGMELNLGMDSIYLELRRKSSKKLVVRWCGTGGGLEIGGGCGCGIASGWVLWLWQSGGCAICGGLTMTGSLRSVVDLGRGDGRLWRLVVVELENDYKGVARTESSESSQSESTMSDLDRPIAHRKVYVDDIILTGDDIAEMEWLKQCLASEFEIKELGSLKFFLKMKIALSRKGIAVSQRKYVPILKIG
ncbi:hypothetical protein RJ640_003154 [Escallonia rubra]|uniref:Reverse transcriptase Ty1/copia-type domain-containing protein n=1 Tax=Escallonia rubra TaxID=112253 RepID=A0AA88S865_9ASTE|nr:hypothetical protein RJ640_003154 [Escallonia rubra]